MYKYLISTVENKKIHKVLLEACKINLEYKFSKIQIRSLRYKKKISYKLIIFFINSLLSLKIFNLQKYVKLNYRGFNVGIYSASFTFKDHNF